MIDDLLCDLPRDDYCTNNQQRYDSNESQNTDQEAQQPKSNEVIDWVQAAKEYVRKFISFYI